MRFVRSSAAGKGRRILDMVLWYSLVIGGSWDALLELRSTPRVNFIGVRATMN